MTNGNLVSRALGGANGDVDLAALLAENSYWLHHHWLRIAIAAALALLIGAALFAMRRIITRLLTREQAGAAGWGSVLGRAAGQTGAGFIAITALYLVADIADPPGVARRLVTGLFTIVAVLQAAFWVRALVLGGVELHTRADPRNNEVLASAMGVIRLFVSFAVFAVALIVVLDNLGVNVTGLVAGLGVGGIAIGLAAQSIFADLFATLAIIFGQPFRVGDVISYDETTGTVEEIGLKSTRIRPATGEERIVANRLLLDKEIRNLSQRRYRRIKFTLAIVYQTKPETAAELPARLKRVVEHQGYQFAYAGFANFADSSLSFELEFDCASADYADFHLARHRVGLAILADFAEAGIEFAYPTQTTFTAAPDGAMILPYAATPPQPS